MCNDSAHFCSASRAWQRERTTVQENCLTAKAEATVQLRTFTTKKFHETLDESLSRMGRSPRPCAYHMLKFHEKYFSGFKNPRNSRKNFVVTVFSYTVTSQTCGIQDSATTQLTTNPKLATMW